MVNPNPLITDIITCSYYRRSAKCVFVFFILGKSEIKVDLQSVGVSGVGLVQIRYHGISRPLCADNWDIRDAHVICRMKGYQRAVVAKKVRIKDKLDRVWLSNVNCFGNESNIENCKDANWNWENKPCGSGDLRAGVICIGGEKMILEM